MSSYGQCEFLGGIWDWQSDKDKLINILTGAHPEKNANAWGKVFDVVYPLYSQGVKDGNLPVYAAFTPSAGTTEKTLADQSGVSETDIHNFMVTLYSAAKIQQISMVILNPGVPGVATGNIIETLATSTGAALKSGLTGVGEAGGAGVAALLKGSWPLIIGIVGVAAILYAPALVGIKQSIGRSVRKVKSTFSR